MLSRLPVYNPLVSMLIKRIDPAAAAELIAELDAYQSALYPPESNHLESLDALRRPNMQMFGCLIDGALVAIGAIKLLDGYGELKRLYVPPRHRGQGLAKAMMQVLEAEIRRHGRGVARLETGIHQVEALGLYERLGYAHCQPFGDYTADPLSVFMEKRL